MNICYMHVMNDDEPYDEASTRLVQVVKCGEVMAMKNTAGREETCPSLWFTV